MVAMACPGRYVVGLDISQEAIKKAKQVGVPSSHFNTCRAMMLGIFASFSHSDELLIFGCQYRCLPHSQMQMILLS